MPDFEAQLVAGAIAAAQQNINSTQHGVRPLTLLL